MKKILNVKQAAKILGVSTNTMYKYLNRGIISAARGHGQSSFRIPTSSIESFLGSKISEEMLTRLESEPRLKPLPIPADNPNTENSPPSFALTTVRLLLLAGLTLDIIDIATTQQFRLANQLIRLVTFSIFTLLAYQQGGFIKRVIPWSPVKN